MIGFVRANARVVQILSIKRVIFIINTNSTMSVGPYQLAPTGFLPPMVAVALWSLASELEASSEGDPVALVSKDRLEAGSEGDPVALASEGKLGAGSVRESLSERTVSAIRWTGMAPVPSRRRRDPREGLGQHACLDLIDF
jgi:hypothetical protein